MLISLSRVSIQSFAAGLTLAVLGSVFWAVLWYVTRQKD